MKTTLAIVSTLGIMGLASCDQAEERSQPPAPEPAKTVVDSLGQPVAELSRQIITSNGDIDRTRNLLARVEVQPNELLEFYEPTAGMLVVSGAGAPAAPSMIPTDRSMGPEELWNVSTGGKKMPASLREALARFDIQRPVFAPRRTEEKSVGTFGGPPQPAPGSGPTVGSVPAQPGEPPLLAQGGYCDTTWFQERGACFLDWHICLDNWWGGAWAQHNNAFYGVSEVCPATGFNVNFDTFTDDSNLPNMYFVVPTNTYRWRSILDAACHNNPFNDCPMFRAEVNNAIGIRFHFRFNIDE